MQQTKRPKIVAPQEFLDRTIKVDNRKALNRPLGITLVVLLIVLAIFAWRKVQSTPAASASAALVGYWKLDEGHGNAVEDSSGNGNNGAIVGAPQWTNGLFGTALALNGTGNFIQIGETPSLEMQRELTVSLWVAPSQTGTPDPRLISKCWSWDIKLNGTPRHPQFSAGGKYAQMDYTAALDQWQHLVFTFENGTVRAYVNGKPVRFVANTFSSRDTLPLQKGGLLVGTDSSKSFFSRGLISDVRVYNRALNDSAVAALNAHSL